MTRHIEPVPQSELERRWRIADLIMSKHRLDALVLQNSNDWLGGFVRWFTGAPAANAYPRAVVYFGTGDMIVIEQGGRGDVFRPQPDDTAFPGVREVRFSPSYVSVRATASVDAALAADALRERKVRRLGWVNPAGAYHGFAEALKQLMEPATAIDVTEDIDHAKAVKSAYEQDLIRRTATLQDQVIDRMRDFIKPGLRDFEIGAYAQYVANSLGAEQGVYLNSSSSRGQSAVFRLRHMQGRTLQPGDVHALLIETNGPGGYYTEIGRTFSLGQPDDALVAATQTVVDAQAYTLERLKPGASCREIAAQHDAYMQARGLPAETRLYCHGQGYDMVERPLIRSDEDMLLEEGMSIVVHPGFVTPEVNGLICDNYLIDADGASECLHRTPKHVIIV